MPKWGPPVKYRPHHDAKKEQDLMIWGVHYDIENPMSGFFECVDPPRVIRHTLRGDQHDQEH